MRTAAMLGLGGIIALWLAAGHYGSRDAGGGALAPRDPARSAPIGGAATRGLSRDARDAARAGDSSEMRDELRAQGWREVAEPVPDARVVGLDPTALDSVERVSASVTKEAEIRTQLRTAVPERALLDRIATIARVARQPETRWAAIEALGREGSARAREHLVGLFEVLHEIGDRRRVLDELRPTGQAADRATWFLIGVLSRGDVERAHKEQAAASLVAAALSRGEGAWGDLVEAAPSEWRGWLERLRARVAGARVSR